MMREESVVSKVEELMETLDNIKKYNALAHSLKKFAIIVIGSITVFAILAGVFEFFDLRLVLDRPLFLSVALLSLLIPVTGIILGVLFVRRKVASVKTGEWRDELSHGFPSALKILVELDWEKTFDEISMGKLSYALYAFLKTAAYWAVSFFALSFLGNAVTYLILQRLVFSSGILWGALALLIVLLVLSNDIWKRYKEILALDMLLMELRWFSFEFRRAEFKT
jgi:hypothetical protein